MESVETKTVFVIVKLLRPGIKVAEAVIDNNGLLLSGAGTVLTERTIAIIKMSELKKIKVINENIFQWQIYKTKDERIENLNRKFSSIKDKNMLVLKRAVEDRILKYAK